MRFSVPSPTVVGYTLRRLSAVSLFEKVLPSYTLRHIAVRAVLKERGVFCKYPKTDGCFKCWQQLLVPPLRNIKRCCIDWICGNFCKSGNSAHVFSF